MIIHIIVKYSEDYPVVIQLCNYKYCSLEVFTVLSHYSVIWRYHHYSVTISLWLLTNSLHKSLSQLSHKSLSQLLTNNYNWIVFLLIICAHNNSRKTYIEDLLLLISKTFNRTSIQPIIMCTIKSVSLTHGKIIIGCMLVQLNVFDISNNKSSI